MAEEPTPTPPEDTSEQSAPPEDTQTPVVNYEQRYNNLRPEFDRTKQQLREYEEQLQALQSQEPEQDDEDYEYEYEDPVARQELAELKAFLAHQQEETLQAQKAEQETELINSDIEALEKELNEEFSDKEWNRLGKMAEEFRDEHDRPDVRAAYQDLFEGILEPRKQKWVKTKKSPKVNSGPAAAQSIDLDDPKTRREYMAQKLQELEGD